MILFILIWKGGDNCLITLLIPCMKVGSPFWVRLQQPHERRSLVIAVYALTECLLPMVKKCISHKDHFRKSPWQDPAGNWTTRRLPDHLKETQTAVVWSCLPFIRSGQNHLARHSERGKEDKADRRRGGKTTSGNGHVWSSQGLRGKRKTEPQRPSRWIDRWWWFVLYALLKDGSGQPIIQQLQPIRTYQSIFRVKNNFKKLKNEEWPPWA